MVHQAYENRFHIFRRTNTVQALKELVGVATGVLELLTDPRITIMSRDSLRISLNFKNFASVKAAMIAPARHAGVAATTEPGCQIQHYNSQQ